MDDYRAYREVLGAGISILHPHAEVETASLGALGERLEHFDPHLVICGGHDAKPSGGRLAWVELPMNPLQPAKVWVDGRYSERANPTLELLLSVIGEVEDLIQRSNLFRGC